ncbi:MAG: hypothetical protein Q7R75_01800, partial [bacterium]|nr:hypothetical protein [bacterium]
MRNKIAPILFIAAVVLSVFWPFVFGGKIFGEEATIKVHYGTFRAFGNALDTPRASTLWLSSYVSGFPVYLSQQGGHLQPIVILFFKIFDFVTAYNLLTVFSFFLSAVFSFWFCRLIGISKAGAFIASLSFSLSQAMMWAGSILVLANLFPLIPLFFVCLLKIYKREKQTLFFCVSILTMTLGWLGAFTEMVLYLFIAGTLFALFLDFVNPLQIASLRPVARTVFFTLGKMLLILFVSFVFASPWILPTFNFISLSSRAGGVDGGGNGGNYLVLSDFIRMIYPYFDVPYSDFIPFLSVNNMSVFLYVGILPLLLGVCAFIALKRNVPKIMWFFISLFVFTFLIMFKKSPIFFLLHKLPVIKMFYGYWKWIYLTIFSWAVLAGYGLDFLPQIKNSYTFKKFVSVLKYGIAVIFSLSVLLSIALAFFRESILNYASEYFKTAIFSKGTFARPFQYYADLIKKSFDFMSFNLSFSNYHFLFSFVFLAGSFFLIYLFHKEKIDFDKFKKYAVVIVALNFALLWQGFYSVLPRAFATEIPKTAQYIKNSNSRLENNFRVFRFLPGLSDYTSNWGLDLYDHTELLKYDKETMGPNMNVLFDVDSITGNENLMDRRHSNLLLKAGSEFVVVGGEKRLNNLNIPLEEKIAIFSSAENLNILSMLNVKYLLSSFELPKPLTKVFETKVTKYNIPVYIYENSDVLPRVYFAKTPVYTQETNEDKLFEELLKIDNFKEKTLIECSEPICRANMETQTNNNDLSAEALAKADLITIEELKNGYLKLKTKTNTPRWLIYSESNLPTWEARINEQLTRI